MSFASPGCLYWTDIGHPFKSRNPQASGKRTRQMIDLDDENHGALNSTTRTAGCEPDLAPLRVATVGCRGQPRDWGSAGSAEKEEGMREFEISTDPSRLDIEVIHGFLRESYWAEG